MRRLQAGVTPRGSEQALSLAWALENAAGFSRKDAVDSTCKLFGIRPEQWEQTVGDCSWFVGNPPWHDRERIEALWNERFAGLTKVWLDEDVWHLPLWQQWLTNEKMIYAANIAYLIDLSGRGGVSRLAKFTGRNRSSVSKWGRWQQEGPDVRIPPSTLRSKILEFFELKPTCDLTSDPLFLGRAELRDALLRIEGKHYLDCLKGEHLSQAVDRLREESARYSLRKSAE
ncbi:MAG: hypothetical protein K9L88_15050 [Chromatiaceae bacterium]|nr:hypothetical protein [Chromatiaceae bacterium]